MELIEFLENSQKRGFLIDSLLTFRKQEDLFGDNGEISRINSLLDDFCFLISKRKSPYQRWTQKIGDKERLLNVPKKSLRHFMEDYLLDFIKSKPKHEACHGGEKGWSVKKSLEVHSSCRSVLSFDLKSAFENIPRDKVYNLFCELLGESSEEKDEVADFLSVICTVRYSDKRGLPQGSPCSMAIFNRVLHPLDIVLSEKTYERRFVYSRWVDDLIISSQKKQGLEDFLGAIKLTAEDFLVSKNKIFFQDNEPMYLLGHKFVGGQILKNTKEEREKYKPSPVCFDEWFSDDSTKEYPLWQN